jgi:hypothetical protein
MPLYPQLSGIRTRAMLYDVPERTFDPLGQPRGDAIPIGEFNVVVSPILPRGREMMATKQVFPQSTHIVTMGRTGDAIPLTEDNPGREVLTRMFLQRKDNNHILNIITAEVDPDTRGWVLICQRHEGATIPREVPL